MTTAEIARLALPVVGGLVMMLMGLGVFAYLYSRHRVMSHGLRGMATVVDVQPISMIQRRSVTEKPTENITVVTAAAPRGVLVNQKVPAGQYRVGQVVPVVQARNNLHKVFLDRPDLERPAVVVYSPLALVVAAPVVAYAAFTAAG